ncbi:MAG: RagB/SusD family nutrient uptake outer membrane protein [Chitinophagaceae bacterium]|nr:RagB/SusD family nutrient uptake outer membrane protein [Chitinophagaceae bacterium]
MRQGSIVLFFLLIVISGCKKLVEIDAPVSSVNQDNVYSNDATAISVLTGIYTVMSAPGSVLSGSSGISMRVGLSADEWALSENVNDDKLIAYYRNALSINTSSGSEFWEPLYKFVFYANSAIEGLSNSSTLTASVKSQLLGEARFVRAFSYFYLVNLFGDLPLVTSTDYNQNLQLTRSPKEKVYELIVSDLKEAIGILSSNYLNGSLQRYAGGSERVRPTKWAAIALLSRVYLYTGDFDNAELQSSILIDNSALFSLPGLKDVFLKNNAEAIWQLQPTSNGWNTEDARFFVVNNVPGNDKPVFLSESLLNAFETGDNRRSSWVRDTAIESDTVFYAYKYKSATFDDPVTEYQSVLRLGEQFLIRSEARAQKNNISGAQSDLNVIRRRAGLSDTQAGDKEGLLRAILQERRIELFSEWGHRWFDLKRTKQIDNVMSIVALLKGGQWESFKQLYPIPFIDIERNSKLIQNSGY